MTMRRRRLARAAVAGGRTRTSSAVAGAPELEDGRALVAVGATVEETASGSAA